MKLPALLLLFLCSTGVTLAATARTETGSSQAVTIGGAACPEVMGWSGGEPSAAVIVEPSAPGASPRKHLGPVTYEPIVLEASLPLSPALLGCFADLCANRVTPQALLLTTLDSPGNPGGRALLATNAVLVEAQFPALDAASKEGLSVTFIFRAENTKPAKPDPVVGVREKTARALTSNFRVNLDGLVTTRIAKVEAFTIKRSPAEAGAGQARDSKTGVPTVIPNLCLSVSPADAESWTAWRDSFLLQGNSNDAAEKEGSLEFLAPDLKTSLFTLRLSHVGLMRLSLPPTDPEKIKRLQADLYCEAMSVIPVKDAKR